MFLSVPHSNQLINIPFKLQFLLILDVSKIYAVHGNHVFFLSFFMSFSPRYDFNDQRRIYNIPAILLVVHGDSSRSPH